MLNRKPPKSGSALFGVVLSAALCVAILPSRAQAVDKSSYHLLAPVPDEHLRPLSADRPDVTESPITVDAGHFQVEASLFDFTRDRSSSAVTWGAINAKVGLLDRTDLQFVWNAYERRTGAETAQGGGDLVLRLKQNLWGADEGKTALAIMPYVKFPVGSASLGNDHVEGGLIVPFSFPVTEEIGVGMMIEVDVIRDEADESYLSDWLHSVATGGELHGPIGWYGEYIGAADSRDEQSYRALLGAGLTYLWNENLMLDVGTNMGLSSEAEDFRVFTGVTARR